MSGGFNFSSGLSLAADATVGGITQLTGDVAAGPGSGAQAATLATVNSNVGSFTYASITVNGKGLITAASSGTAPATPGMVLLASATPSGTGTVTFNSISGSYSHLRLYVFARSTNNATFDNVTMRFNNDSAANYDALVGKISSGGVTTATGTGQTFVNIGVVPGNTADANAGGSVIVDIPGYALNVSGIQKSITSEAAWKNSTVDLTRYCNAGWWRSGSPITRIDVIMTGNFVSGSLLSLYGVL